MQRIRRISTIAYLVLLHNITTVRPVLAQSETPCGVVDSIGFPFESVTSYHVRFPFDYAREGWGYHAGEDWFSNSGVGYGDAIVAIARGRVTYSSRFGWGVDKGVVIVEHTLRDGSLIYSVYGHMEALNGFDFPHVGACVERGDIVGAIGDPRGRPHLHFEIRHKWPTFPGFGYTQSSPDLESFEDPTAFVVNWQAWLNPAYKWHTKTAEPMTAPPALAPDGTIYVATEGFIQSYGSDSIIRFRYALGDEEVISNLSANSSGLTAYTTEGELRRYRPNLDNTSLWYLGGQYDALVDTGSLVFVHANGGTLRVYDQGFVQRSQFQDVGRPLGQAATNSMVALATGQRTPEVLLFSTDGQLLQRASLRAAADVAPAPDGGVLVRSSHALWHVSPQAEWHFIMDDFEVAPSLSTLATDGWGSAYLFAGKDDRQLLSLDSNGGFHWQTPLDDIITTRPIIAIGGGCGVYLGTSDGRLAAINAATGELGQTLRIHPGDRPGQQAWLAVSDDETVFFAVGGTQIIALDGRQLIGLPPNTPCVNPY